MLKRFFVWVFLCFALAGIAVPPLYAQSAGVINSIVIEGNQRIETDTIRSFLPVQSGSVYDETELSAALNELFKTGYFADIALKRENGTLIVRVIENPIINEVSFEGNKRLDDEDLLNEIQLKPRAVYTKTVLQQDVSTLQNIYQKSGRFSVLVTPKVITLDQNRVNLVFEIEEGKKTEISRINFVGNKNFSDEALLGVVQTRESRWYRFFSSDDSYDPDRLSFDQELLRRFYVARGYADFRVTSATAELTPEKDAFFVTFVVDEGDLYNFGTMGIESAIPEVNVRDLQPLIASPEGETFNADQMDKTIENMSKFLGDQGYAFVDITPNITRNVEQNLISVVYKIDEAPRVYVDQINITGNVRTLDRVIRREFRLSEGDPYNASQLKRSQQRIENLGYFKRTDVQVERDVAVGDKVDINVAVEEQSTGELSIGAGFSSTDGALGDVSITERNLLGKGQLLRLNTTIAASRQQVDLGFTEPYFLDRELAAGFDIFRTKRVGGNSINNFSYDLDSLGGVLRMNYPLTEHLSHNVRYSLRSDDITNIDADASTFIQQQEGKNTTSLVGQSLIYDTLDSRISPKNGYTIRYNLDVAGLGGDAKFIRNELRNSYFMPTFNEEWILKLFAKGGIISAFGGEDIRINNRFFLGSTDVRGFDNDGIGPHDSATGDPLGGNVYYAGTVEQTFPIGLSKDFGFTGSIFSDFGSLFDVDASGLTVEDESSLRLSVGVGLSWVSPVGPVRIDFAEAVQKEEFDETELVRFSFGTKF